MANNEVGRIGYSSGAIFLHWAIAILILFNLFSGFFHDAVPKAVFAFHISSGITILVLTIIRIGWRLTHKPPPFLPMAPWERGLAHVVHFSLYLVMLAAPLTGWAMISAHADKPTAAAMVTDAAPQPGPSPKRRQTMIWGLIPLPKLAPIVHIADQPDGEAKIKEAHELFEERHETIGWIFIGLLILHIAGALKHQLIDRRRELARMGIGKAPAAWDTRT
ncbi:cytochrome b [Sphingomonas crusticola]|uniref:cytochrome b n=1 Tax=Sphingomonas crusticola TaxID=1697973 RepID=UPI001F077533|nr:cytochrome b [Sphingomonas crusticola]